MLPPRLLSSLIPSPFAPCLYSAGGPGSVGGCFGGLVGSGAGSSVGSPNQIGFSGFCGSCFGSCSMSRIIVEFGHETLTVPLVSLFASIPGSLRLALSPERAAACLRFSRHAELLSEFDLYLGDCRGLDLRDSTGRVKRVRGVSVDLADYGLHCRNCPV